MLVQVVQAERGLVVTKQAIDAIDKARLVHEMQTLGALGLPGLVEPVDTGEADAELTLTTRHAGSITAADYQPEGPQAAAWVMAALATTVANLHQCGFSHNALTPDHVIISADSTPVLCSLGYADQATSQACSADLESLNTIGLFLHSRCAPPSGRAQRRWHRELERAFGANGGVPAVTPEALAQTLAALSGRGQPSTLDPSEPAREAEPQDKVETTRAWRDKVLPDRVTGVGLPRWQHWPRRLAVAVCAGALLAAFATRGQDSPSFSVDVDVDSAPAAAVAAEPDGAATTRSNVTPPAAQPSQSKPCVLIGDGPCQTDIEVVGNLVRVGQVWFEVGQPGDSIYLGDWDCNGTVTPAIVRPSTTEVFVFDAWAIGSGDLLAAGSTRIPDLQSATVERRSSCDVLKVGHQDGSIAEVQWQ